MQIIVSFLTGHVYETVLVEVGNLVFCTCRDRLNRSGVGVIGSSVVILVVVSVASEVASEARKVAWAL